MQTLTENYLIKTIDVTAKEWFDKVNGNSYFSAQVTLNYAMDDEQTIYLPFQYGYGEHYLTETVNELISRKLISKGKEKYNPSLWRYCDENGIVLRKNKIEHCKNREVKDFGKG